MEDNTTTSLTALAFFQKHPLLGIVASIASGGIAFIHEITPYLQFFSLVVGISLGMVTMYAKIIEIHDKHDKDNENKQVK